jgi:hypothetical protein
LSVAHATRFYHQNTNEQLSPLIIGSKNSYVLLPPPANDLTDSLIGEAEGGGQAHDRFAPLVAPPDPFIAVMLIRRVVGEGHRWHFSTDVHEQHPVVDRVHRVLHSPGPAGFRGGQALRARPDSASGLRLPHPPTPSPFDWRGGSHAKRDGGEVNA